MFNRKLFKEKAKNIYQKHAISAIIAGIILWFVSGSSMPNQISFDYRITFNFFDIIFSDNISINFGNPFLNNLSYSILVIVVIAIVLHIILTPMASII
ncbi:MAG: hypothetical protein ACK5LC_04930 [Coprobacillaceae bacterium]